MDTGSILFVNCHIGAPSWNPGLTTEAWHPLSTGIVISRSSLSSELESDVVFLSRPSPEDLLLLLLWILLLPLCLRPMPLQRTLPLPPPPILLLLLPILMMEFLVFNTGRAELDTELDLNSGPRSGDLQTIFINCENRKIEKLDISNSRVTIMKLKNI